MAILKSFWSFPAVALALALISQSTIAADYDPDGFHECVLENIEGNMGKYAVIAVRQSCAYKHGTDAAGNRKAPEREPFSMAGIPEDSLFAQARKAPEFTTFTSTRIVEYVRRKYHPDRSYQWVKDFLINTKVNN